jgi:hypothetical protein
MARRTQETVASSPLDRIERFLQNILLRLSTSRIVDGLWIGAAEGEREPSLDRVEGALRLIKTYDPRRYQRLLRDLDRIWVHLLTGYVAQFNGSLRACEIEIRFVVNENTTLEVLAATIVHEATHARLEHCGIQYDAALRERIEKACIRQEVLFASRLPGADLVHEWAQSSLESLPNLTDGAFRRRHWHGGLETLRYIGAPEWLLKGMRALRARRIRASRRTRQEHAE